MKPLVGPVIGRVSESSTRILLEYEYDISASITLIDPDRSQIQLTKIMQGRKPTIFKFEGLKPDTKYIVKVYPYQGELVSSFKTFKDSSSEKNMNIAWISCNNALKNQRLQERNLWYFFQEQVLQGVYNMACHIGNQVYLDNVYNQTKGLLFGKCNKEDWNYHQEQIKEMIREEYRRAWSFPPTAAVLANIPNIMIYGENDIREQWGYREEDWNPNTEKIDYFFGKMCQQVYYEYQRQLWDDNLDINDISHVKEEYFTLRIGKIGFYFMDILGDRTWHRTQDFDPNNILSQKQWNRLDFALNVEFKDVENFILVSQTPIVFLNNKLSYLATEQVYDVLEQWVIHPEEQVKLLKKLYNWKFFDKTNLREVSIICGDIHFGGHIDIFYKNKPALKQFTSSSITNSIKQKYSRFATEIGLATSEQIQDRFSFYYHGFTGKNNFGFTHIYNQIISHNKLQNMVDCCLVVANEKDSFIQKKFILLQSLNNHVFFKRISSKSVCCSIF